MTTFEEAKNGDRAWNLNYREWGRLAVFPKDRYPIRWQSYVSGVTASFTYKGKETDDRKQTLFWGEIKFEAPPRPKRKVKKWFKLFKGFGGKILVHGNDMRPVLYDDLPLMEPEDIGPFSIEVEE